MPKTSSVDTYKKEANEASGLSHITTAVKTCKDCQQSKPLEEFSPNKRCRDGRTTYCKPCLSLRHRAYRDARRGGPPRRVHARLPSGERAEKWCPHCRRSLPLSDFGRNASATDGLTGYCKRCHLEKTKASQDRNGGAHNYHLLRRYGITVEDYDRLVAAQGGVCALCRVRPPELVDHDHLTGAVRGVLCSCCNQGLGNFRDDAATARAAADYLERTTWQRHQEGTGVYRLTSPRPGARRSATSSALQHLICSRRVESSLPVS